MPRKTKKKTQKRGKRVKKWFLRYDGTQKHINLPGIGRIVPGKEYPIDEQRAYQFKEVDPKLGWKVLGRILYEKE